MTPSITETSIRAAIRSFLISILPNSVEVTDGQLNRVDEPLADNFVVVVPAMRRRLGTNVITWDQSQSGSPTAQNNIEAVSIEVDLDFHGANSTDNAQVFATLFRTEYACDFFTNSGIQPDYCTDGRQMPFINGQDQFEDRWVLRAVFDAQITVSTTQQFFTNVEPELINVDVAYPPT